MASSFEDAFQKALQVQNQKSQANKIIEPSKSGPSKVTPENLQDKQLAKAQVHKYNRKEVPVSHRKKLSSQLGNSNYAITKQDLVVADRTTTVAQITDSENLKKKQNVPAPIKLPTNIGRRRDSKPELRALINNSRNPLQDLDCYKLNSIGNTLVSKPSQINPVSEYTLEINSNAKLIFLNDQHNPDALDLLIKTPTLQHHKPSLSTGGVRQLTLGLDFGTSCVKCIVGDGTIKHAYAIPFLSGMGIDTYLLPSVLYEENGIFSLDKKNISHNNLKLGFLESPKNQDRQALMVAFMGLVIRQSLAWFLLEHQSTYLNSEVAWALSVGVPAPQGSKDSLSVQYAVIARAAWYAAWNNTAVSRQVVLNAIQRASKYNDTDGPQHPDEDVEIHAIAEIAAQIHGFIEGSSFDPDGRNIYLMVDVGAGTVDSSLFHVKRIRGNKSKFSFYESKVGNYGVMNLHRTRMDWWKVALAKKGNPVSALLTCLDENSLSTESKTIPPRHIEDYFTHSKLTFSSERFSPDHNFRSNLNAMIIQSYKGSFKDCNPQVLKNNLYGIDAFLCGGGFKMPFYQFIEKSIDKVYGASYLHATPKLLQRPSNFTADVNENDYNRLSVAYGLSSIRAEVARALPIERDTIKTDSSWNASYVSKDDT